MAPGSESATQAADHDCRPGPLVVLGEAYPGSVAPTRFEVPPPGGVAWLEVTEDEPGRPRTGPLGMRIAPLRTVRAPFSFKSGRLRGTRCVWSASTASGTELHRPSRQQIVAPFNTGVHILIRADSEGSVYDPVDTSAGLMRVFEASDEIAERIEHNAHLFTLNVPLAAIGIDLSAIKELRGHTFTVTPFQSHLLRAAVGLLLVGGDELSTPASLIGVDRYIAALAGLLLRTAMQRPGADLALGEQIRRRTDAIIEQQAADPTLSPSSIAAQLDVSLRQLYRAFNGTESPAARIRRCRLARAADILRKRSNPGQVEQIAAECGFSSAEYFSRAFRKEFGRSPRAYRAAHRDKVVQPVSGV